MEISLETNITINVEKSNFAHITKCYISAQRQLFEEFVTKVILCFFQLMLEKKELEAVLKTDKITMKSGNNKTIFKTLFGKIYVPQMQIRYLDNKGKWHQFSCTRYILGVNRQYQIPDFMKSLLGWVGAMTSYRIGQKIVGAFSSFTCSLMSVWNSVQYHAGQIKLSLSEDGINEFESDATGIPTKGSGKRGSELKKVFQRKENGKLHLVAIAIGKYKELENWSLVLKESLTKGLEIFEKIILASDCDKSIISVARSISNRVKIQMDLWHVFHQLKYYLWQDKAGKELRNKIIANFYKIAMLYKRGIKDRTKRIKRYLILLESRGFSHTATYLTSVMENFYTYEKEGNKNRYTSKTERSMRTTNQRINVGVWSEKGSLNVSKIRLSYYYNGISPLNWKNVA